MAVFYYSKLNFLGNIKAENYQVLVATMLLALELLVMNGENDFIKILKLWNIATKADETVTMTDYCWSIMRDCPEEVYKRKSYRCKFLPGQKLILILYFIHSCILCMFSKIFLTFSYLCA